MNESFAPAAVLSAPYTAVLSSKMHGLFGAILGLDDHRFCCGIELGDGAMNGADHVVRGANGEYQQCRHGHKSKQILHSTASLFSSKIGIDVQKG